MAALFFNSAAWANASLYRGGKIIGSVATVNGPDDDLWVSAEEVGSLLGFASSRSGDELLLNSHGNTQIRILINASAAWRDTSLIPLTAVPFERDGRYWINAASAVSIFQRIVGSGAENRLRFTRSNSNSNNFNNYNNYAANNAANAANSENAAAENNNKNTARAALSTNNNIIELPELPDPAVDLAPTARPVRSETGSNLEPTLLNDRRVQAPLIADQNIINQVQHNQRQAQQAAAQHSRYETFKPDVEAHRAEGQNQQEQKNKKSQAKSPNPNAGAIQRVRWSVTQAQKRIRAVVDASDGADPDVNMSNHGEIHALFASAPANIDGMPAPYENIKLNAVRRDDGVELIFTSGGNSIRKVEKLILSSPRRIVFDFFFTPETVIKDAPKVQSQALSLPPLPTLKPEQPTKPVNITPPTQPVNIPDITPQPVKTPVKNLNKIVVVDPGHGGKDPGTSANGVREKDVNLAIGLLLERELKSLGFKVVMTRRTDVYLKLQERTNIANKAKADVFVSVHVNALPSAKKTSGFEIYLMALPTDKDALNLAKIENREYVEGKAGANNDAVDAKTELLLRILGDMQQNNKINESTDLAEALFKAGNSDNLPMKRVAQAPFFVLRGAGMPAVLLETGFVTNAAEAKLLAHPGYQERIARAMAAGVADYLR